MYKINGIDFPIQPSSGKWIPKNVLGIDGSGHTVYSGIGQFEITWDMVSVDEYNSLLSLVDMSNTGTIVAELPKYGAPSWVYYGYTGSIIGEPSIGEYFETYYSNVVLLVTSILSGR